MVLVVITVYCLVTLSCIPLILLCVARDKEALAYFLVAVMAVLMLCGSDFQKAVVEYNRRRQKNVVAEQMAEQVEAEVQNAEDN